MRDSLILLIIAAMLLPPATIDIAWASETDLPEPFNMDLTSYMPTDPEDAYTGFTIIAPFGQKNVYLVDNLGSVVHTWRTNHTTKGTTELLPNGTLLRGSTGSPGQPWSLHLLDWNGSVLWDYQPPSEYNWHHDIEPLPNGNFLINTEVPFPKFQAVALGRDPAITMETFRSEGIVEIKPNGTNGGDIVWMWDPLDHLIQDYSSDKPNYGVVRDHPELINLNYPKEKLEEWQHTNSVSYNAELDQIMITDRNYDEFWVIDHNTTTEEAAGHSGGARGKGGDILYRWGNPLAYDTGSADDHILYGPHDAHWISPGLPGAGNIIVFNNGINMYLTRPEGNYSTVEELVPPINATGGYNLTKGSAYGPSDPVWSYNASPPENFYAWAMGGVERLPNNHTLICGGSTGYIFEIDEKNEIVWDYRSNQVFRANRYYPPALEKVPDLMAEEDVMLMVNLSSFISDLDTDQEDLVISERSIFGQISGHNLLLCYPEGNLADVIQLTVSDGIFEVRREVRVNIAPVNDPPVLASIPDVTAIEGIPYYLDPKPFIFDLDTDIEQMIFTADSSFVTVEGLMLKLLYPNGVLSDRINLTVSDGELEDWTEILVNVTPVNDPPIVDRIEDQEGVEDTPWTIDLGLYVGDVDNPIEDISVISNSRYTTVSGLELTLQYPDGVVSDVVSLTVSDGESETVVVFKVTIEPVNDPPVIGDILPLNVTEDESFTLDVGLDIFDIDTPKEELTLKVDSPFIVVVNYTLTLLYPDGPFQDSVVVEIWDGDLHASTTLVVNVMPVNDPPVIGNIPPLTVREDESFSLDLGPDIFDCDTPPEELTLRVDSPFIVVEGHILIFLYPDGIHEDEVVIEVWDGELHASTTLVVNIEPVNDPPWWAAVPDIAAVEDVEGVFNLEPYMFDMDTALPDLSVDVDSIYGLMEGNTFIFNYPNGVLSEQITFTLTDGEFQVVLMMNVSVSPVNDAPQLSNAFVDPPEGSAGTPYRFTVGFMDIDMGSRDPIVEVVIDGVTYRCAQDESDNGRYDEGVIYYLEMDLGPGDHSFHFIADDGAGDLVTTEPLSISVRKTSDMQDNTFLTIIVISTIIVVAVALMAILLTRRMRSSGSSDRDALDRS